MATTTNVTPRGGGGAPINMKDYAVRLSTGIADSRASTVIAGGGKPLLRLMKSGHWVFGPSNEKVQEGSSWAINIMTLSHGWQCWVPDNPNDPKSKNSLQGEIMVPMTEPKPLKPPAIKSTEYSEVRAFELKCADGDDEGVDVLYKVNSIGGMRAVDELLASIYRQLADDPEHAFPVVQLSHDFYDHKAWGQIAIPIFEIVSWTDTNLIEAGDQAALANGDDNGDEGDQGDEGDEDNEIEQPTSPPPPPRRRISEPAAAAAANQRASERVKPPLRPAATTSKGQTAAKDEPAPTAANRTGQRRRPGR